MLLRLEEAIDHSYKMFFVWLGGCFLVLFGGGVGVGGGVFLCQFLIVQVSEENC